MVTAPKFILPYLFYYAATGFANAVNIGIFLGDCTDFIGDYTNFIWGLHRSFVAGRSGIVYLGAVNY